MMMITRYATQQLKSNHFGSLFSINKDYNFEYDIYLMGDLIYSKGLTI